MWLWNLSWCESWTTPFKRFAFLRQRLAFILQNMSILVHAVFIKVRPFLLYNCRRNAIHNSKKWVLYHSIRVFPIILWDVSAKDLQISYMSQACQGKRLNNATTHNHNQSELQDKQNKIKEWYLRYFDWNRDGTVNWWEYLIPFGFIVF